MLAESGGKKSGWGERTEKSAERAKYLVRKPKRKYEEIGFGTVRERVCVCWEEKEIELWEFKQVKANEPKRSLSLSLSRMK